MTSDGSTRAFPINLVSTMPLITIKGVDKQYPDKWKIFIPPTLIHDMIKWYHKTLVAAAPKSCTTQSEADFICQTYQYYVEDSNVTRTASNINN